MSFNGRYPNSDRLPNTCNFSLTEEGLTGNAMHIVTSLLPRPSLSVRAWIRGYISGLYHLLCMVTYYEGQHVLGALECSQASVGAACHSHVQAR